MRISLLSIACLLFSTTACLADDTGASFDNGRFTFSGSVGLANIEAKEYVYLGSHKGSQLDWESKGVTLYSGAAGVELTPDWSVTATVDIGTNGDGHMVDYDWVPGLYVDTSMDGWSDRSISPDTRLSHYFAGSIEIARQVYADDDKQFGINAGFKYSDVKWESFGGTYIYSDTTTRDDIGAFPDGLRVISYQQKIPVFFVGLDGSADIDRLTVSGGAKGGFTTGVRDIDDHWGTNTRYHDDMYAAPVVMLNVEAAYHVTETASLYLGGSYENVFNKRGDVRSRDTVTGETDSRKNGAGASYQSMSVKFGLKGTF
ncbi:outer membrane protease [Pararhizobium capsulatum DSM 1112]|uniref:Outer membrane protease n=1 Tax=Pararhizobium capsulatum DSM 1112 TaxID=1121113 RepID=A0ABU0BPY5_9HYPH|nr:omptin family outer membrane protease [Pararhizobium capsulatum]MDQ0319809.1 outer membrane protease [Pararhizobium capsulatum DSM 1112]